MNIILEIVKTNEVSAVVDLLKKLYLELGEEAESVNNLDCNLVTELINTGKTTIFLAKINNREIAGIATVTECQSIYAGGKYGLLDEMYVKPDFRSLKIDAMLVAKVRETAQQHGWKRIDVTAPTEDRWKRTVKFYESCGFVFTGPKLKFVLN